MSEPQWPGTVIQPGRPPAAPLPGAGTNLPDAPQPQWPGTVVAAPRTGDVGAQSVGRPIAYDRTRLPSVPGTAAASMPAEIDQRIRVLAADLFPAMPVVDAARRFGIQDGKLFYVALDGKSYWAEPRTTANPRDLALSAASAAGPALPFIGGAIGGLGGTLASIPAAAGGAAAGDAARQGLANLVVPEGAPDQAQPGYDWTQSAGEAAMAGAGQGVGLGIGRLITRNPVGVGAMDRNNAQAVARSGAADAAQSGARAQGMSLSFGQATNLRSVREAERALAADPTTADVMQQFYENQRRGLRDAVLRNINTISPKVADDAAASFRGAAGEVGDTLRRQANTAARPHYQAAEGVQVPLGGFAPENTPIIARAMSAVRGDPLIGSSLRGAPDDSVKFLDQVRKYLDDQISVARQSGENNRARLLSGARDDVQAALLSVPEYKLALDAARPGQQAAARIEQSGAARVSSAAPDAPARQITAPLFDYRRASPAGIAQARSDFVKAGRLAEWNDGLRAFIEGSLDVASKGIDGGASAVRLRSEMWADPRARAAMQAAMDGPQFASFSRLMQVVEHVARTLPENSATANKLMASDAVDRMARGAGAQSLQLAGRLFSPLRLADTVGAATDRLAWGLTQKGKEALAAAMTDPANADALRRLRLVSPTSQAAINLTSQMLLRSGLSAPLFGGSLENREPQE